MKMPNQRPALDAAVAFSLHIGRQRRGASEAERSTMRSVMVHALMLFVAAVLGVKALGAESSFYERFRAAADVVASRESPSRYAAMQDLLNSGCIWDSSLVDTNNAGPILTNAPVSYAGFTSCGELAGIKLGMAMSEVVAVWGKPRRLFSYRDIGPNFRYGEGEDLSLHFSGDRLVWISITGARAEHVTFDNGLTGMMGRADTERLLGAPALRYISPAASRDIRPADLPDPLPARAPATLRTNIQFWSYIGKYGYRAAEVRTDIGFKRALTQGLPDPTERLLSIDVCLEREGEPFFELQGGVNGRQPFSAETNRAPAAAASRRSP